MTAPPAKVAESEVLTEVPDSLKRLVRLIVRGFYEQEHALIIDLLVHHACIREEDCIDRLKFDQKQLRTAVNTLKNDRFIKVRMRMETSSDGKTNKQHYYFINYSTFVNVVKYKLDHMRRKIEMEERTMTSRASFKCPGCENTFTDLEAGLLFDPFSGVMKCTYCGEEVIEDGSSQPRTDARTLMVKFNEQIEPIFSLLREVEDVRLSQDLLEPEPADLSGKRGGATGQRAPGKGWSGDKRMDMYNYTDTDVSVNIESEGDKAAKVAAPVKQQPLWMTQSTIKGAEEDNVNADLGLGKSDNQAPDRPQETDDIMKTLLAHEKKAPAPIIPGLGGRAASDDSSTSESEDESGYKPKPAPVISNPVAGDTEMMSDDDDDVPVVTVAGQEVSYDEVTEEMTQRMTPTEKENYIRIGQEMYQSMFE